MRKIKIYVTATIDGFAVRPGEVPDHTEAGDNEKENADYRSFCDATDTILMGNKTYQEVLRNEVRFPVREAEKYVFTRNPSVVDQEDTHFISTDVTEFARRLLSMPGKDVWLLGGISLFALFLDAGLIHEIYLTTVPVIAGLGTPLFPQVGREMRWRPSDVSLSPDGLVRTVYRLQ